MKRGYSKASKELLTPHQRAQAHKTAVHQLVTAALKGAYGVENIRDEVSYMRVRFNDDQHGPVYVRISFTAEA